MGERRLPAWPDLGLAAFLLFLGLMGVASGFRLEGAPVPPAAVVLVVLCSVPVLAWRWHPVAATALVAVPETVYTALGYPAGPVLFTLAVVLYGLTSREPVRVGLAGVAAVLAAGAGAVGVGALAGRAGVTDAVLLVARVGLPAASGFVVRVRRDAAEALRAEQARRVVSEERLELARELHDVVGHGLAVIAMQAGVGLRWLDRDPARARQSLESVRSAATEALDGLRAELRVLRQDGAPRTPAPGLAELPALVDRVRQGGLPIVLSLPEAAGDVPAAVAGAVHRVVQEALTNVLRHAGPAATARVEVTRTAGGVAVEVSDTGRGCAGVAEGEGIRGMRRRVGALGGCLVAGPGRGGGFAVRACVPCPSPGEEP